jgi:CP family cyanate transporter-like MFS transporter
VSRTWTLALLWLAGVYLRLPVLVAPPLAPFMGSELGLNQTEMGALTTIPVLMLSLGAMAGAFFISRAGPVKALAVSLVVLAFASAARGLAPPSWLVFVFTALFGLAIAVMQPAFPALVLRWCPRDTALASAVYMNGMLTRELVGAGVTLPVVMPLLDGSWRASLVAWSLPAVAIAVAVLARGRNEERTLEARPRPHWQPPWRDPLLWQLGIVLGAASAGFFGANAYLGSLLSALGQTERLAELLAWFNGTQVIGSLSMLLVARGLVGRRWPFVLFSVSILSSLVGLFAGGAAWMLPSLLLLGLATCIQLILAVSVVPELTDQHSAAPLASGMFMVGYLLGFVVPFIGGLIADAAEDATLAMVPLIVLALLAVALSVRLPLSRQGAQH